MIIFHITSTLLVDEIFDSMVLLNLNLLYMIS
jgi:hypothetical protein